MEHRRGYRGPVSALAYDILEPIFQKKDFLYSRLVFDWLFVVGEALSSNTNPRKIVHSHNGEGVLYIDIHVGKCGSVGLEAYYKAHDIVEKVNRYFGYKAIGRLVFKKIFVDTSSPDLMESGPGKESKKNVCQCKNEITNEVREQLNSVPSTELREALEALARSISS